MYYKQFLFIISLIQICHGAIERDLLLTPKEGLQILGRTLFYDPPSNETNGLIPWQQTLKHVTFLTLFPEIGRSSNLSELTVYKDFIRSPYTRIHEEYPRFGDIITMARGWLEKRNEYHFVEGVCEKYCGEKVLALWRVQKIRHRDSQRGFRYEMKFSVTPSESVTASQNKHALNEQYFKSFILKDDDYPGNFNPISIARRSDSAENFSNEREARIVNEIPRRENALLSHIPPLNIGEYFKQVPKASAKIGYLSSTRPVFPTTYRPNYHVKFAKPEVFDPPEEPKTVVTHHFHHHYFMNDADATPSHNNHQIIHGNPDAIRIIEGPNAEHLSPQYAIKVEPVPYTTTTVSPPPAVFYMQQIPLYIQSFPQEETTSRQADSKPFKQSEQQFEAIRYSDPDPLYENVDNQRGSSESASDETHAQVERTSPNISPSSDSISAQLPPPTEDQDARVPYVDEEEPKTTYPPTTITTSAYSTRRTLLPKNKYFVSTSTSETPLKYASKISLHKVRNYPRTTTEQPVLKWKPKQKLKQKSSSERPDNAALETSTEEKVVTVTPSVMDVSDFEILTQKSVSKSISVKVGNRSQEIPITIETGAMVSSETKGDGESGSDENDTKS